MSTTLPSKCPQCGAPIQANAPGGLCPRCVMALNLQAPTAFTDEPAAMPAPPTPAELAPSFPQLEILECLGRGGMGVVYKARQPQLDRFVALKILAPERVTDARFADRFLREAQALARLNHPNIVTIHDFGQAGGYFYLLMEFIDGLNLRDLLRRGPIAPKEALAIVPAICEALQFAHDRGVIHRDIKPENILLDKEGRVKIADFGIARMMRGPGVGEPAAPPGGAAAPSLTSEGILGTPKYMAPEQAEKPGEADHRADIYSLGVVFYEMLTGELPGKSLEPPSKKVHIDVRLDEIVLRALEKKPELRFQQASVFKTQVETLAGAAPAGTPPADFARPAIIAAICAAIGLASLFVAVFVDNAIRRAVLRMPIPPDHWRSWSNLIHLNRYFFKPLMVAGFLGMIVFAVIAQARIQRQKQGPISVLPPGQRFAVALAGLSGILGIITLCSWPNPPTALVLSIPLAAVLGIILGIQSRLTPNGKRAIAIGTVNLGIWLIIAAFGVFHDFAAVSRPAGQDSWQPPVLDPNQAPYTTRAWFPSGDFLEIASVNRTDNTISVTGHYKLASQDRGSLQLSFISTNQSAAQAVMVTNISKGAGDFQFANFDIVPGLAFVSIDSDGQVRDTLCIGGYAGEGEAKSSATFGTARELTLRVSDRGYSDTLDLDSGSVFLSPRMNGPWNWPTNGAMPVGVMVIPRTAAWPTIVAGTSTMIAPLPWNDNTWEGKYGLNEAVVAAESIVNRGETETATGATASGVGEFPQSFIFKTLAGNSGLLQITGLTDDGRGVRVRYKLVQSTDRVRLDLPPVADVGPGPLSYRWVIEPNAGSNTVNVSLVVAHDGNSIDTNVQAIVHVRSFWASFGFTSLDYDVNLPSGYTLRATSNTGHVNTTHSPRTGRTGMPPRGDYHSLWMYNAGLVQVPPFQPGHPYVPKPPPTVEKMTTSMEAMTAQFQKLLDEGPIPIGLNKPKLLFSITNSDGELYQGSFELVPEP